MSARRFEGIIVSVNAHQTAIVSIARQKKHPIYKKRFVRHATFAAHNPNNTYGVGDSVLMEEVRPISKTKRWVIRAKIGQADLTKPVAEVSVDEKSGSNE